MYECVPVGENTFYIDSPTKIGVYRDGGSAWLIDSGNDAGAARKALRALDELHLRLEAAIITHFHADHTGGAAFLQQRTGCRLLMAEPLGPAACPELNSALLYGAHIPKPLRGKFFLAQPAAYEDAERATLPAGMELARLDGHAFSMLGVRTADGVWFIGDALTDADTLEKYKLTYLYDVEKYLDTLERVTRLEGRLFVPAHPAPMTDTRPMAEMNRAWALKTADALAETLKTPLGFDELLKRVFDDNGLQMSFGQHALLGAVVHAFLTWLMDQGRVSYFCEDGRLLWKAES